MVANKAQTIRNFRKRKTGNLFVEDPIVLTQDAGSSDTESTDIVRAMAKRKKEAEEQRVIAQRITRSSNKSPSKKDRVKPKVASNLKPVKVHGPSTKGKEEEKVLIKEERIAELKKHKVLNGKVLDPEILTKLRMCTLFDSLTLQNWEHLFECPVPYLHEPEAREFYYNTDLFEDGGICTTVPRVEIALNEESLGIILGVLSTGIRSVEGCKPSPEYVQRATMYGEVKFVGSHRNF
ncbi:hypothetical protein RDI58_024655 [Solanum bulbocastanum]|uniref:Uncharacterized protein n=1 Tax=Solanum bulbocastanum TaxID=147425 RepID=A0AAN8T2B3_SOLBU